MCFAIVVALVEFGRGRPMSSAYYPVFHGMSGCMKSRAPTTILGIVLKRIACARDGRCRNSSGRYRACRDRIVGRDALHRLLVPTSRLVFVIGWLWFRPRAAAYGAEICRRGF